MSKYWRRGKNFTMKTNCGDEPTISLLQNIYLDELTILEWKDIGDRRSILEPKKIIIILMFTW